MSISFNILQENPKSCLREKGESPKNLQVHFQEEDPSDVRLRQEERKLMRKARQKMLYSSSPSSKALQIIQEASPRLRSDATFVAWVFRLSRRENIEEIATFIEEKVMEAKIVQEAFEEVTGFSSFAEYKEVTDAEERVSGMVNLCVIL
ncbi:MAG: hypothetical protein FJZ63_00805 [Chlamydiae bacterium]|nr:hypothetical protein [Chlamydiota bacterium]